MEQKVSKSTRVIHAFDREGDITEVFDAVRQLGHTGVLVRAAYNRSLDPDSERLWAKLEAQPISFQQEIARLAGVGRSGTGIAQQQMLGERNWIGGLDWHRLFFFTTQ